MKEPGPVTFDLNLVRISLMLLFNMKLAQRKEKPKI